MNVAAYHAIKTAQAGGFGHGFLELADEGDGVLHLLLDVGGDRPIGQAQLLPGAVVVAIEFKQQFVANVPRPGEPAVIEHDAIELIAVADQQSAAIGGGVNGFQRDLHPAKAKAGIGAQELIVIAGDEDHPCALGRHLQHPPHNVVVARRPEPATLQLPAINDVPHQIEGFRLDRLQEIQQHIGVATRRAEVDIGNPYGAQLELATRGALIIFGQKGRARQW